jgi:hypothetical protein
MAGIFVVGPTWPVGAESSTPATRRFNAGPFSECLIGTTFATARKRAGIQTGDGDLISVAEKNGRSSFKQYEQQIVSRFCVNDHFLHTST